MFFLSIYFGFCNDDRPSPVVLRTWGYNYTFLGGFYTMIGLTKVIACDFFLGVFLRPISQSSCRYLSWRSVF